jgi:hypothetical protein
MKVHYFYANRVKIFYFELLICETVFLLSIIQNDSFLNNVYNLTILIIF